MTRSDFIRQVSLTVPIGLALPAWLDSCSTAASTYCPKAWRGKVTIVGAGAAGLYAAHLLYQQGVEVEILEAATQPGGRIRSLQSFAGFPIELGAEELHGANSTWYQLIQQNGFSLTKDETTDYYYYKNTLQKLSDIAAQPDVKSTLDFVKNLPNYTGSDVKLQDLIAQQGDISQTDPLYNALIGNEYGTSDLRLGARSLAIEDGKYPAGNEHYYLTDTEMLSVLQNVCAEILSRVKLNVPIAAIDYHGASVVLTDTQGRQYGADKVLVTVPLAVLQKNLIAFTPTLPPDKVHAISTIGMGNGLKIILKFNAPFWAAGTGSIYGTGAVPEFWVTSHGKSVAEYVLTAFIMGEAADYLSSQGSKAVGLITQELDTYYGNNIASKSLINSYIMDWGKERYIGGAYSYPSIGSADQRAPLAAPIKGKVFFAGEATSTTGNIGTVHGAIETAERAVREILCG